MFEFKNWKKCGRKHAEWLKSLRQVDEALVKFENKPTGPHLDHLKHQLRQWTLSHPRWQQSQWNNPPTMQGSFQPITELVTWVDRLKVQFSANYEAIEPLRAAGQLVLDKYGSEMEGVYKNALQDNFVAISPHDKPVYCFKRFNDPMEWGTNVNGDARTKSFAEAGDTVIGMTPTLHRGASVEAMINNNLKSLSPPYDRRIEFQNDMSPHNLVHEMLHWCCHEGFRTQATTENLGPEEKKEWYVLEGFTEWLTRKALGKMNEGSYQRIMHKVIEAVASDHPTEDDLFRAYFKGVNVVQTGKDLISYVGQVDRNKLIEEALKQLAAAVSYKPNAKETPTRASGSTCQLVADAFKGCEAKIIDEKLKLYPNWIIYIKIRLGLPPA